MKRAIWALMIALWVCLLASSLFTRVEADDYCFAVTVREHGVVEALPASYLSWAGRFSQQLIHGVFASVEPYGSRLGVPLMLTAFVLAWWYAFACWYSRRDALLLALAFGAVLAISRPNDEPIYWLSGVTSYWLPVAGAGLLVGALVRRRTVLAALTAFLTVAFTEVGGVFILTGLALGLVFWKGERRRLAVVFLSAAVGYLIIIVSPGNALRKARFISLDMNLELAVRILLGGFATNVALSFIWSIIPGITISGIGAAIKPPFKVKALPLAFLGLALGGAAAIAAIAFVSTGWGMGERVIYLLVPLWLAHWFFLGALIGQHVPHWRWATFVSLILLVFAVWHVGERAAYAADWDARDAQILAGEPVRRNIGRWDSLPQDWALSCAEDWYGHEIQFIDESAVP